METADIRIISTSYTTDGDEPVIELYGKARDGRSVTVLVRGFKPYLYGVEVPKKLEQQFSEDPEVVSLEHKDLLYRGRTVDALKITIKSPWKVSDFRNKLRNNGVEALAADIPYNHRYVYDMDMGACIRVTGEPVDKGYLTDLTIELDSFENVDPFDPGLKVLSFDIENSIEHEFIYCICATVWEKGSIRECDPIYGTEKDIIQSFSDLIRKEDPDVITGYNIDNYDIRKIEERAKANRMKDALPWGRDGGQPKLRSERFWRVKGRLICDAWWAARRELRPKQETLNAVSLELLGESKLDVDPRHMDDEWKNNREKVLKYCTKDAELALRILLEVDTLRKGMDLAAVSKLSVEDVLTSGSSQLADSLLIRAADRANVAVPQMGRRTRDDDQIEGGYVHDIKPGLYHWVCVLDFKSMYPSTIIAKNICFTTLSPDGAIVAPSGTAFVSKDVRLGLLPMILQGLMDQRDSIKKRMKQSSDEHEKHYLDGLQAAVKVLMNTFYGVFASSFYRFTDKSIGAAITSFARANVKGIIGELQSEGHNVVYSDTDSVFVQSPGSTLEESVEFGTEMADRYSRDGGTLEFEKILEPLFTHGKKKRYVGRIVWPTRQEELLVRGYESRRTDSFDLQNKLQTEMFACILDERNDDALALARKTIQDTLAGRVDNAELVISKTCKGMDAYENPDRMANVQAAKKLMDMGYDFIPGMKVSWIVTDARSAPMKVEPWVSGKPFEGKADYRYYAERLSKMAGMVTDVFGWSEKDLLKGSQQATLLDGGMFESRPGKADKEPPAPAKPKPKMRSLDDFFRSERFGHRDRSRGDAAQELVESDEHDASRFGELLEALIESGSGEEHHESVVEASDGLETSCQRVVLRETHGLVGELAFAYEHPGGQVVVDDLGHYVDVHILAVDPPPPLAYVLHGIVGADVFATDRLESYAQTRAYRVLHRGEDLAGVIHPDGILEPVQHVVVEVQNRLRYDVRDAARLLHEHGIRTFDQTQVLQNPQIFRTLGLRYIECCGDALLIGLAVRYTSHYARVRRERLQLPQYRKGFVQKRTGWPEEARLQTLLVCVGIHFGMVFRNSPYGQIDGHDVLVPHIRMEPRAFRAAHRLELTPGPESAVQRMTRIFDHLLHRRNGGTAYDQCRLGIANVTVYETLKEGFGTFILQDVWEFVEYDHETLLLTHLPDLIQCFDEFRRG